MVISQWLLLFFTAFVGGALNSVAGGGSFFTFPSLVVTGVPPIPANATSAVALWPGSVASIGAYRRELAVQKRTILLILVGTSLIGGVFGAILLLKTPQSAFESLLPYLLLFATVLFAVSPYITQRLKMRNIVKTEMSLSALIGIAVGQLIISIYGGYFGGGLGILMLAALALMGMESIHSMNALKALLATCINGVAVVTFIAAGVVAWPQAILMAVGTTIGGYGGGYYARKIDQKWVRLFVIVVGLAMSIYFFIRY